MGQRLVSASNFNSASQTRSNLFGSIALSRSAGHYNSQSKGVFFGARGDDILEAGFILLDDPYGWPDGGY